MVSSAHHLAARAPQSRFLFTTRKSGAQANFRARSWRQMTESFSVKVMFFFLSSSFILCLRAYRFFVSPSAGLTFHTNESCAKGRLRPAGLKNLGVRDFLFAASVRRYAAGRYGNGGGFTAYSFGLRYYIQRYRCFEAAGGFGGVMCFPFGLALCALVRRTWASGESFGR